MCFAGYMGDISHCLCYCGVLTKKSVLSRFIGGFCEILQDLWWKVFFLLKFSPMNYSNLSLLVLLLLDVMWFFIYLSEQQFYSVESKKHIDFLKQKSLAESSCFSHHKYYCASLDGQFGTIVRLFLISLSHIQFPLL